MREIQPADKISTHVPIPGSKSYTHRVLIAAALSDGTNRIKNTLQSEDTMLTAEALRLMGVSISDDSDEMVVVGNGGKLKSTDLLYLGNSGTGMRFLTAVTALADGKSVLTGTERMKERPVSDLIDGLNQLGIEVKSSNGNGCPPVEVNGRSIEGGNISLNCDISSQYLSAILLISPYTVQGVHIEIAGNPVSKPYIDMTIDVMERFGVSVKRRGYSEFYVSGGQVYRAGSYFVEPDASNASYFWAAAAITGGRVTVDGLVKDCMQGDMQILKIFEEMGCRVEYEKKGVTVVGDDLRGIDIDMGDMPDMVPTVAVVAAFAVGETSIRNVAHLKVKESDRIFAITNELYKMGICTSYRNGVLTITGGAPRGAKIETYNDHRIVMAFSVAGLKVSGIQIKDEVCVAKSFPDYWKVFDSLYQGS